MVDPEIVRDPGAGGTESEGEGEVWMPLSHGQLSVLRSVQQLPDERFADAHLSFSVDLGPNARQDDVEQALQMLSARHEGLRTVFDGLGSDRPRQRVLGEAPGHGFVLSVDEDDTASEAEFLGARFDLERDVGWRSRMVKGADGARVHVCVHHMLADGESLEVLRIELAALIADPAGDLEPAGRMIDLVREEEKNRSKSQRSTRRYWLSLARSGVLRAATTPAGSHSLPGRHHVGMALPLPAEGLESWSASHRLLISTVPLVGACLTTMLVSRSAVPVLTLMYNNRWDPVTKDVVASLNQVLPITAPITAETTWMDFMKGMQMAALSATRHARYDVDDVARIMTEELQEERELDNFYNYLSDADPEDVMTDGQWVPGEVHTLPIRRESGPPIDIRALGRTHPVLTFHYLEQQDAEVSFAAALEATGSALGSVMSSPGLLDEPVWSTLPKDLRWS